MKAKIIQGLVSRIICLTCTRNGKKDAELKVHFRIGKELSAEECGALGGVSIGTIDDLQVRAPGNCNVGADV